MSKIKSLFCMAAATLAFASCKQEQPKVADIKASYEFQATDTTWKTLSLREKIGQTMMVQCLFDAHKAATSEGTIKAFMEKYPVGSIFMCDWYFREHAKGQDQLACMSATLKEYNAASKYPLFVSEDFERGIGETYSKYTQLPTGMALGAAGDSALAYDLGKSIAMEAKEMGFNWLLHPVCDLNMNPLQDLVVERSVSDDAQRALPILKGQMNGMHGQGVVSTVKHFPGDGVSMRNQHLVTSTNALSKEEWNATFGQLFKGLIDNEAATIMVGHIRMPAYQTEKISGQFPPATISKELMVDLLKNKLNYKGVIITDALNMGACAGYYKDELEVSIQCFAAGADIVLWPSLAYMDSVEARINRGEIPMSRLDDAVSRVWALRERFGLLEKTDSLETPLTEEAKQFVKKTGDAIAEKSVTLVENSSNLLPIKAEDGKRIAIIQVGKEMNAQKFAVTERELEKRGFEVDFFENPHFYQWGWRIDSLKSYDKVIVSFDYRYFHPFGASLLKDTEAYAVWTANMMDPDKRIAISYANPYMNEMYQEIATTKINAYSCDTFTQKAVVKAICGEIPFQGVSPVKLNRDELK